MNMPEDEKPQIDKFKDAARDLECDDDELKFRASLKRLVRGGAKKNTDSKPES